MAIVGTVLSVVVLVLFGIMLAVLCLTPEPTGIPDWPPPEFSDGGHAIPRSAIR
jgi:hypothetical protein